jgi:exosome complex RNA-binding protein Rrp4
MVSITGTEKPYLGVINGMTQSKNKDEDLTTWNRVLNAGDVLQYEVVAVSNVKRFLIALKLRL